MGKLGSGVVIIVKILLLFLVNRFCFGICFCKFPEGSAVKKEFCSDLPCFSISLGFW